MSRARPHLVTVGLACALWLLPGTASAEWFDDYERGVEALAKGRPKRAIPLLEKTIRKRPEPGSNLITYGTNRLKEYYPYLKLAEAHLALGNLDAAEAALERSETKGKEPTDARARLQARWREAVKAEEARAQLTAPPPPAVEPPKTTPTAAPTPPPPVVPRTGTLVVRSQPTSGASVLANDRFLGVTPLTVELDAGEYEITVRKEGAPPERVSVRVKAGETNVLNQRLILPQPKPAPVPERRPAPEPPKPRIELPSLLIVTEPPGTSVYLDDELIGSTDPKTGRLMRSGVADGSHRIRLSRTGYAELAEDIEIEPEGETLYQGTLAQMLPEAARSVEAVAAVEPTPVAIEEPEEGLSRGWLVGSLAFGFFALVFAFSRWRKAPEETLATLTAGAIKERSSVSRRSKTSAGGGDATLTKAAADTTGLRRVSAHQAAGSRRDGVCLSRGEKRRTIRPEKAVELATRGRRVSRALPRRCFIRA